MSIESNPRNSGHKPTDEEIRAQMDAVPDVETAGHQIAEQEGEFYHLTGDTGEGVSIPLDTKTIAERAQNARDKSLREGDENQENNLF